MQGLFGLARAVLHVGLGGAGPNGHILCIAGNNFIFFHQQLKDFPSKIDTLFDAAQ